MPLTVDIRDALDLKTLQTPRSLRILKIDAEDYTDWTGDPALRITVVLDESTEIERVTGEEVGEFKLAIHDNLLKNGIKLFPYKFFAKPSDLIETDEE
ncbi:MAG: hypothetical protein HYX68_11440 [Planctomycetes bacterium]|nr:hypothetical protein [Planctomycetota bacterium]